MYLTKKKKFNKIKKALAVLIRRVHQHGDPVQPERLTRADLNDRKIANYKTGALGYDQAAKNLFNQSKV